MSRRRAPAARGRSRSGRARADPPEIRSTAPPVSSRLKRLPLREYDLASGRTQARDDEGGDMRRWWATAIGLVAIAAVLAPGAGAAKKTGAIQFYVTGSSVTTPILVTGVVTDHGTATSVTKAGKPDENGNYEKIVLKKGGFWVDATQLNKLLSGVKPTLHTQNCYFSFKGTGPTKLFKGTGAYAGISGNVSVTVNFVAIGPRLPNGKCNTSNNAAPVAEYGNVTGSGTASY